MSRKAARRTSGNSPNEYSIFGIQMGNAVLIRSATESPVIEHETREQEAVDLPWQVVVHNDPVNLMSYVTMVFQKVFGLTKENAERHMLEVHQLGRSILWS